MGNYNCARCCEGGENKHEIDLKKSTIIQAYQSLRDSFNQEFLNFSKESIISSSKEIKAAIKIQKAWYIYQIKKQFINLKKRFKPNDIYFPYKDIKETLSPIYHSKLRKEKPIFTYRSGATYKGSWLGGFRDGPGIMIWPDGCSYEGEWSYGYPYGRGKFIHIDKEAYDGDWKNPYNSGKNTLSNETRSVLRDIIDGKRDGYMWLHYKDERLHGNKGNNRNKERFSIDHCRRVSELKEIYDDIASEIEGPKKELQEEFNSEFSNNWQEISYDNQIRYLGEIKHGKRVGKGRNVWPNGDIYEGYWANDMQNGWGRNIWADGSSYIGFYKDNQKEGIGEYIWEDGTTYKGQWKDNVINGIGKYNWPDGREYLGEWINGIMHGFGIFSWKGGKRYEGTWHQGKKHGTGYSITANNKITKGFWSNGKIVS